MMQYLIIVANCQSCDKNLDWEQNEKMINKLDSLDDA